MDLWAGVIQLWVDGLKGLAAVLNFLYTYAGHDYGLAIILLTLGVRLVMLPLTIKQTRSMQEMQRVQPMLKKLQEKYKDDKPKLQEEMMRFYSEHKINPLGGCLPMLLQFPILIALFRMLTFEPPLIIQNVPYNFWIFIPDLSKAASTYPPPAQWVSGIPYYVLVLLMIVTTYVPQKMMTKDPQQEKIMIIMSIFMAWIAWSLPAGVIVYWVTTNVWTIGQQWVMMREQPAPLTAGSSGGAREIGAGRPQSTAKTSDAPSAGVGGKSQPQSATAKKRKTKKSKKA